MISKNSTELLQVNASSIESYKTWYSISSSLESVRVLHHAQARFLLYIMYYLLLICFPVTLNSLKPAKFHQYTSNIRTELD